VQRMKSSIVNGRPEPGGAASGALRRSVAGALAGLFAGAVAGPVAAADVSAVALGPAAPGATLAVAVIVDPAPGDAPLLGGLDLEVAFDADRLTLTGVAPGIDLLASGVSTARLGNVLGAGTAARLLVSAAVDDGAGVALAPGFRLLELRFTVAADAAPGTLRADLLGATVGLDDGVAGTPGSEQALDLTGVDARDPLLEIVAAAAPARRGLPAWFYGILAGDEPVDEAPPP
jgi:hypothetical protein